VRFRLIPAGLIRPLSFATRPSFLVLCWFFVLGFLFVVRGPLSVVLGSQKANGGTTDEFFSLNDVRPGLHGVGRTVFEGDKIEEFQVEIRGVLKNVLAPKRDVILAHLSGAGLEKTGVVAGMSGSPVYVDGKLLGAVAIAFPFSKDSYALITPIQDMLDVVPQPAAAGASGTPPDSSGAAETSDMPWRILRIGGEAGTERLIPQERHGEAPPAAWARLVGTHGHAPLPQGVGEPLGNLRLPLRFGGFSTDAVEAYAPLFREMGLEPVAGAVLSAGSERREPRTPDPESRNLEPGSMVSLLFARGDLNLNADCTVTYRQQNNLYACGHQIFLTGPAQIPFAKSHVLAIVPSLATSFKIDSPGPLVGTIHQDRFGAIYGVMGDTAPSIPVHIQVNSSLNRKTDYNFEVVQQSLLSPLLLNLAVISTLSATERMAGPSTLELNGKIHLSSGDTVDVEDVLSSEFAAANAAGAAAATPLSYVLSSDFPGLRVDAVDLSITSRNKNRVASLEQVWSTQSEVQPGDRVEVTAVLRTPSGESLTQKIPVDIPESVSDKTLSLVVGSGPTINALQNRFTPLGTPPRDLRQLVRALNRTRRNNRLYALLLAPQRSFILQGDEFPSPPPSLLQTFLAAPGVSSSAVFSGTSVVGDYETKPTAYAIQGQQTLYLKVVSARR
jgi:hypothetical protein